jgi:hypothetical protein
MWKHHVSESCLVVLILVLIFVTMPNFATRVPWVFASLIHTISFVGCLRQYQSKSAFAICRSSASVWSSCDRLTPFDRVPGGP